MVGVDHDLMRKCNIMGRAFEFSVNYYHYDSASLVKKVMTDKRVEYLFEIDDCQDWCDGAFLMSILSYKLKPIKGECADPYAMWFLGYLYKYWMKTRGTSCREIYKILPFERFMANFEFYHTQGWEYIIENAIEAYKLKNYII